LKKTRPHIEGPVLGKTSAEDANTALAPAQHALDIASGICQKRGIAALADFIESCRTFACEEAINVAIFGRFKAGKSSFLNCLMGRPVLPVGVVPVTAVVTEIEYGPEDRAEVLFVDGNVEPISLERIGEFISEAQNPENSKQVLRVRLELCSIPQYRGIRFVDTPGLESVLEHNTQASRRWLPKVGLALVAVGVDPPLSQHDLDLIRDLGRYTPRISLLLTKVDLVDAGERSQVQDFVRRQLASRWDRPVSLFPFSTRPGLEALRARIDAELLLGARAEAAGHRAAILLHKIDSLLGECSEYVGLALKAAERGESERDQLRSSILGEKQHLDDTRQALRLIVRHAAASSRAAFEKILKPDQAPVREKLLAALDEEFRSWSSGLSVAAQRFEDWLGNAVDLEMTTLSGRHRAEFVEPIGRVNRQLSQALQDFRNRLSERALKRLGVPLPASEMELHAPDPSAPDIRVGKIFDRNWELLSFILPMWAIREMLRRHFRRKVADVVAMNLSRLATQWEEAVNQSLAGLEKEAIRRLEALVATIDALLASDERETPRIRAELVLLDDERRTLAAAGRDRFQ
jgi:GTP-binding protein EngB required for normal cell division